MPNPRQPPRSLATFAGGCFWCMVAPFENLPGVASVTSGYAGGHVANPTYEQVCSGLTGAVEAVQVEYDPMKASFGDLLGAFWRSIDPTDDGGQFADRGERYTTAVYYRSDVERKTAEESKRKLAASFGKPIATRILPFTTFYPAEEYHQDYHRKNPLRYEAFRLGSGRDAFLQKTGVGDA